MNKVILLFGILIATYLPVLSAPSVLGFRLCSGFYYSFENPRLFTGLESGGKSDYGEAYNFGGALSVSLPLSDSYTLWLDLSIHRADMNYDFRDEKNAYYYYTGNSYPVWQEYRQKIKVFSKAFAITARLSRELFGTGCFLDLGLKYTLPRRVYYIVEQYPTNTIHKFSDQATYTFKRNKTGAYNMEDELHCIVGLSYPFRPFGNYPVTLIPYAELQHFWRSNVDLRMHFVFFGFGIYYDTDKIKWPS